MADEQISEMRPVVSRDDAARDGLPFYYTGKPCKHGHLSPRYTRYGTCQACAVMRATAWGKAHPEKTSARGAAYRAANREKTYAAQVRSVAANPELYRKKRRRWHETNIERVRVMARAWDAANRETVRCYSAKRRGAPGRYTKQDVHALFEAQRGKCGYCKISIREAYHIDHIIPIARGGSNWPKNLQLLCAPCNQSKSAKDPLDFARGLGRLL